jgi:hypothetical protein
MQGGSGRCDCLKSRRFAISVARAEVEPALDDIALPLDLERARRVALVARESPTER